MVRVSDARFHWERQVAFDWGTSAPRPNSESLDMSLGLRVIPRSVSADLHLAGFDNRARVVLDDGEAVDVGSLPYELGKFQLRRLPGLDDVWRHRGFTDLGFGINVPLPEHTPTYLRRLEGSLRLYSEARLSRLRIPPRSAGKSFSSDGVVVEVRAWQESSRGDSLRVALRAKVPPLTKGASDVGYLDALLLGKRGQYCMPQGDDPGQGDAVRDLEYEFNLLQPRPLVPYRIVPGPLQPKCLLLTFARFGEADKSLPFVIEGIPVRQVR